MRITGTEDSGHYTFLQQIANLHGKGFSESECQDWRKFIIRCIFQAIQILCRALEGYGIAAYSNKFNVVSEIIV